MRVLFIVLVIIYSSTYSNISLNAHPTFYLSYF